MPTQSLIIGIKLKTNVDTIQTMFGSISCFLFDLILLVTIETSRYPDIAYGDIA
jgi:hypothetical protein